MLDSSTGDSLLSPCSQISVDEASGRSYTERFAIELLSKVSVMTIDKSLKVRAGMIRQRNVLTRAERLEKLTEADRWTEEDGVLGLPKVRVQKVSLKKKKKVKKLDEEDGAETTEAKE